MAHFAARRAEQGFGLVSEFFHVDDLRFSHRGVLAALLGENFHVPPGACVLNKAILQETDASFVEIAFNECDGCILIVGFLSGAVVAKILNEFIVDIFCLTDVNRLGTVATLA